MGKKLSRTIKKKKIMKITEEVWERFKNHNKKIKTYIFGVSLSISESSLIGFFQEWENFRKRLPKKVKGD